MSNPPNIPGYQFTNPTWNPPTTRVQAPNIPYIPPLATKYTVTPTVTQPNAPRVIVPVINTAVSPRVIAPVRPTITPVTVLVPPRVGLPPKVNVATRPLSPRATTPPRPTISPVLYTRVTSPVLQASPASPFRQGFEVTDEDRELNRAIYESIMETNKQPAIVTAVRDEMLSPTVRETVEIEDELLAEAIRLSMVATEKAEAATYFANQMSPRPASPPRVITPPRVATPTRALSPRAYQSPMSPQLTTSPYANLSPQTIRDMQDFEYQEGMRIDLQNEANAKAAAQAAEEAAAAAAAAVRALEAAKLAEEARRNALQPPVLVHAVEEADNNDIFMLRFKFPNGSTINHSFHRREPLSSVIQQAQYDLKYPGQINLVLQPNIIVTCSENTPIEECKFANRILVMVRPS